MLKFTQTVRMVIYETKAIEHLNSDHRLRTGRGVFSSAEISCSGP